MENAIIHIPNELFALAESSHFEGTYEQQTFCPGADEYTFLEPLRYAVDVTNVGNAFLVSGKVVAHVSTQCARCLDTVEDTFTGSVEGFYLIDAAQEAPEDREADEFEYLNDEHTIDLVPLMFAALIMEFPLQPLCKPDCKGLCAGCGANLNYETCTCSNSDESDEPFRENPFAVLKSIKFE